MGRWFLNGSSKQFHAFLAQFWRLHALCFLFFDDPENGVTFKIVIRHKKMFIIITVLNARAVVIEGDIELPFRFSNVLCLAYFTFEEVYYEFTFTISFMVDFVCFPRGYAFELVSGFYLITT